jgi:hypothetical protein
MCVQLWGEKSENGLKLIPPKLVHFVSPKETKINRKKITFSHSPLPLSWHLSFQNRSMPPEIIILLSCVRTKFGVLFSALKD